MKRQRWMFKARKTEISKRGIWEPVESEMDVLKEIRARLQYNGIPTKRIEEPKPCRKCKTFTGKPAEAGIPDLIGYIPPRTWVKHLGAAAGPFHAVYFEIEVKRPKGGVHRLAQTAEIEYAHRDGVLAFFANSWEVVREEFSRVGILLPAA